MTRCTRLGIPRLLGLSILLLPAALSACIPLEPPPASANPEPGLTSVHYTHTVHFSTDRAELTPTEVGALRDFAAALPPNQRISARVLGHADSRAADVYNVELSARRAARVAELLRAAGIGEIEVETAALGESWPVDPGSGETAWARNRRVDVLVDANVVVLPGCPNWSRDPGFDPLNLPLSNLGCANAYNLGLMVSDPSDLVPRRALGPADGAREAEAIVRYRTDKVKQIDPDIIQ